MWFDVVSKYEATQLLFELIYTELWFDVESKYEATVPAGKANTIALWFDVESKYEATIKKLVEDAVSCGLMFNQDMKQLSNCNSQGRGVVV